MTLHRRDHVVAYFGITRTQISYWVKKGCPVHLDERKRQTFNLDEIYAWHTKYNEDKKGRGHHKQLLRPIPEPEGEIEEEIILPELTESPQEPLPAYEDAEPHPTAKAGYQGDLRAIQKALKTRSLTPDERVFLEDRHMYLKLQKDQEAVLAKEQDNKLKRDRLVPLDNLSEMFDSISNVYRGFASRLQKQFGEEALDLWNEHLDKLKRVTSI